MEFLRNFWIEQQHKSFKLSLICLSILALIHLYLDIYLGKHAHLIVSSLLWSVIFLILWDKREDFRESQDKIFSSVGYAWMAALLVMTVVRPSDRLVGFFPLLAFLGWLLIFISFTKIRTYLKEFAILAIFGLPKLISESAFDLAPLTANFSTYILWYLGQPVSIHGVRINVLNGSVEVVPSCSGVNLITHMLSISIMALCLLPVPKKSHKIFLPLIAIVVGFVMNSLRVALLALLSPPQFSSLFQYWHSTKGASIIVLLAVAIYGLICFCILSSSNQKHQKN